MRLPKIDHDVTTALLDIDGTVLDSNGAHAAAWAEAFAEAGYDVPVERVRPLIGMGGDRVIPALVPSLRSDRDPGSTIAARRAAIFKERYVGTLHPTIGARALLERLRGGGMRIVLATSAMPDELDGLLDAAGVRDLIDVRASSGDAPRAFRRSPFAAAERRTTYSPVRPPYSTTRPRSPNS